MKNTISRGKRVIRLKLLLHTLGLSQLFFCFEPKSKWRCQCNAYLVLLLHGGINTRGRTTPPPPPPEKYQRKVSVWETTEIIKTKGRCSASYQQPDGDFFFFLSFPPRRIRPSCLLSPAFMGEKKRRLYWRMSAGFTINHAGCKGERDDSQIPQTVILR